MIGALAVSVLLAVAPAAGDLVPAGGAVVPAGGAVAFRIADPRIGEASGLALGQRWPGVAYVQNDSGDTNRFFAVSTTSGRTLATLRVPGASNVDWEDIATARDAAGTSSVWLSDTGDNDADRSEVRVYRIDEPGAGGDRSTAAPDVWRLRYPGGPRDVESLAVAPDGAAYLVTKEYLGSSTVYRMPRRPDPDRVQTVREVATVSLTSARGGGQGGAGFARVAATGAAFSADGTLFAVRTYTDAYVWTVEGDLAAALAGRPVHIALPAQRQGEGIAIGRSDLLVDSEGVGQPVYRVPLPAVRTEPTPTASTPASTPASGPASGPAAPTRSADGSGTGPASAPASPGPARPSPSDTDDDATSSGNLPYVIGAGIVIVLAAAAYLALHRRQRRG